MIFTKDDEKQVREWARAELQGLPPTHMEVPWPDSAEASDLGKPAEAWLHDLNLLEKSTESITFRTPFDKQAITAGTTFVTKLSAAGITFSGTAAAVVAYLKGWENSTAGEWVLLACASAVVSVTILALAMIVRADLQARATASAAQYEARAHAASAYLRLIRPIRHSMNGTKT